MQGEGAKPPIETGPDEAIARMTELFRDFGLAEARWETEGFSIVLRRGEGAPVTGSAGAPLPAAAPAASVQKGTPVSSPMTGVYYAASSPSADPFVREGDAVTAGQVVGLIEAMKVYNEITAPTAGTVLKIAAKSGDVVNPGDPILFIG